MKKLMAVIGTALAAVLLTFGLFGCTVPGKLKVVDIPLTDEDYAFAVQKNNAELMSQANALIAEMKANGEFETLINKYMGDDESEFIRYENPTKNPNLDTQLVVATNSEFAPFEFKLGNFFTGVDIEVAARLATIVGKPLYIADMDFDAVVLSTSGTTEAPEDQPDLIIPTKAHIGMAGLTITEERQLVVDFTSDYYHSSQVIVIKDGDKTFDRCTTAEDVMAILKTYKDNVKFGFQNGTTGEFFTADNLNVTPVGNKNGALAMEDLKAGRVNAVIIDMKPANAIVNKMNAQL